ncbi:hypothetical protein TNCV_5034651 [Trichonephila clavipes]|nr:hypothetical protein TNCV_5034651 [Trichonephila clavipes]
MRPSKQPRKLSNFSKKSHLIDEDMLELHPDDDGDLMDMLSGSSKPSSKREESARPNNDLLCLLELSWSRNSTR